ncbi:hypothetical protein EDB81DRAFT_343428 [Dactylonectria macrodidyma]|uniref:DUF2461 domain-containing protein n=1 Tax=Dactylonectria macrodidyma TaxID=307937 RepID=A0A9P9JDE7_9HYPO|nr:hypothetical protein EDB81DRAFT_343428 [Dactylonectria macrodidyma]
MPPRKRPADEAVATPRRSSRRTSTKSQYFDGSSDELNAKEVEGDDPLPKRKRGRPSKKEISKKETPKKEDSEEPYQDEEETPEHDDDDSDDSDAPPKVTFIPLPKLLDPGGIEYEDEKLHPNTLLFLKELKANNRRPWLKSHDAEYRRALKDWESFVMRTTETISEVDETIPELPAKDVIFRIYRDARFSKDPTPYKPHFSAAWSRTGRKGPYACYYIHCEPGSAFIGGGMWAPEWDKLLTLRASIDRRPRAWRRALSDPDFKQTFLPELKPDSKEKAVLRAFAEANKQGALKKAPSGYPRDHPDIELLRLKTFTVGKKIDDSIFTSEDAQEKIAQILRPLVGFVTFLNNIMMPDPNDDDDNGDEDDEEEDAEREPDESDPE